MHSFPQKSGVSSDNFFRQLLLSSPSFPLLSTARFCAEKSHQEGSRWNMPLKDVLLAPGPSQVPERVRFVLAEQSWYHRSARFKTLYKECRERLARVFGTQKSDVLLFAG